MGEESKLLGHVRNRLARVHGALKQSVDFLGAMQREAQRKQGCDDEAIGHWLAIRTREEGPNVVGFGRCLLKGIFGLDSGQLWVKNCIGFEPNEMI